MLCASEESADSAAVRRKAAMLAGAAGTVASYDLRPDSEPAALLSASEHYDLLVVAGTSRSRAAGFLKGSAASYAVHSARVPVLVVRPQDSIRFPGNVLVATAGERDAETVRLAARIAAAHHGHLILGHAGSRSDHDTRHALAQQAADAREITGTEPVVLSVTGDPTARLCTMAVTTAAGLMVVGSSGREGLRAVASVSERLAHRAPCSVLVNRPRV